MLSQHVVYAHVVTTTPTTCQGTWYHADTIHGNVVIMRCTGCADRLVTHNGRRVDLPATITARKAVVRWVRAQ